MPDQLKWAEYIGVSIVAQFLLFPHVEGEVLEGNLLSGVDCVIQGFHDPQRTGIEVTGFFALEALKNIRNLILGAYSLDVFTVAVCMMVPYIEDFGKSLAGL